MAVCFQHPGSRQSGQMCPFHECTPNGHLSKSTSNMLQSRALKMHNIALSALLNLGISTPSSQATAWATAPHNKRWALAPVAAPSTATKCAQPGCRICHKAYQQVMLFVRLLPADSPRNVVHTALKPARDVPAAAASKMCTTHTKLAARSSATRHTSRYCLLWAFADRYPMKRGVNTALKPARNVPAAAASSARRRAQPTPG